MGSARFAVAIPILFMTGCATPRPAGLDRAEIDRLFEKNEFRRVVELCTRRLKKSPTDFYALEIRAWALFWVGAAEGEWSETDRAGVMRDCAAMEKLAPDSISPWLLRAFVAEAHGDALDVWGEGIRNVEAAGGDATQLHYFRARALFRLRRDQEALADCGKALAGLDAKLGPDWTGHAEFAQRAELLWWLAAFERDSERKREFERRAEKNEGLARSRHEAKGYDYSPIRSLPRGPKLIEFRVGEGFIPADAGDEF